MGPQRSTGRLPTPHDPSSFARWSYVKLEFNVPKRPTEGEPTRTPNPDAEFFRMFGIGCAVLFVAFLCGWAVIALFWLNR